MSQVYLKSLLLKKKKEITEIKDIAGELITFSHMLGQI